VRKCAASSLKLCNEIFHDAHGINLSNIIMEKCLTMGMYKTNMMSRKIRLSDNKEHITYN
jgi:hypothetical protein